MSNLAIKNYLVVFIDLLGQRAQMEGLLFIPPKSEATARQDFHTRIVKLISAVAFVQQNVAQFAKASNGHNLENIQGVDEKRQEQVQQYRATDICYQHFSDGIVVYSPLSGDNHYPLGSAYSVLCACSSIMLLCLDKGFPIRAGIAIGAGCTLNGEGVYGPVVAEAYRLESEVAKYVRIVVHDEILKWLASFEAWDFASEQDKRVAIAMATKCREMLMVDRDGVLTLDFLNQKSLDLIGGAAANAQPIAGMRAFVSQMVIRFTEEKNERVLTKYAWLSQYIDSRLPEKHGLSPS